MTEPPVDATPPGQSGARLAAAAVFLMIGVGALLLAILRIGDDGDDAGATNDAAVEDTAGNPGPTGGGGVTTSSDPNISELGWPTAITFRPPALGTTGAPAPTGPVELAPGLYLWSDLQDWHLWAVGEDRAPISGTITVSSEVGSVSSEGTNDAEVSAEGGRITFTLAGGSDISGIRFNPGFFSDRIEVAVDGDAPTLRVGALSVEVSLPLTLVMHQPLPGRPGG